MTKSCHALVLHKSWSGDTSARVHFFTRELGLIQSLCKGGRTPKKQSLLQPFTPLWLALDERYDQLFLRSVESTEPTLVLNGSALFSALYVNELLFYVLKPMSADAQIFDSYWATLTALTKACDRTSIETILRRFEWTLIKACGYSFSWTEEAGGAARIDPSKHYAFIASEGFIRQTQGIPGEHILALAEDKLEGAYILKSAKNIMRQAIDHLTGGKTIKARSLFL